MAISGVADTDVANIAQYHGVSRQAVALQLNNYAYRVPAVSAVDSGSKLCTATVTNVLGYVTVDWGDGTLNHYTGVVGTIAGVTHTYATSGTKTITVTGYGYQKTFTRTIA